MRNRQTGITFIGWLVLLTPVAMVAYAGIRITPLYLNYMKVTRSLNQLGEEFAENATVSAAALKISLQKRFDIESVDFPTMDEVTFVREGGKWVVEAKYEDEVPLFANVVLVVKFDKVTPFK